MSKQLTSCLLLVVLTAGLALADATSDYVAKLQKDTGIAFAVPTGLKASVDKDMLMLAHDPDVFIVVGRGATLDAAFDATLETVKQLGGPAVKMNHDPKTEVDAGVTGKYTSGTLELQGGKKGTWEVFAFDAGSGKVMTVMALGDDLKSSAEFNALIQSVKKR